MKKSISMILAALFLFTGCVFPGLGFTAGAVEIEDAEVSEAPVVTEAPAATEAPILEDAPVEAEPQKTLSFNEDGTFKIMQINDTQDVGNCNKRLPEFLNAALDLEQPDLVIFNGDQLSDVYPSASLADFTKAIANIVEPLQVRGIPFLVTLGNHDHDRAVTVDENGQYAIYAAYENCYAAGGGPDPFTYNVPIMTSDGSSIAFNIYMMDTNNKDASGSNYMGITAAQLAWYNSKSAELRAANGGDPVPSLLFQHVPVKEIYNLLRACDYTEDGAVYSRRDKMWYVVDESKAVGSMGEAPCSEAFETHTGQYQAWLANGDIMGAFFAHDHVNNFVGTTDDGIYMGYNGGTGFRSYGSGDQRSVRIFELKENDVENYTTRLLTYAEATGNSLAYGAVSDVVSPAILTTLMKTVYSIFSRIKGA